ncbi:hypothetical protein [Campylobacter hyointestinalis]|uniref:hypothetical protein n=2 Tax=Campylobacter hyointestinalis TaxID=198 RepID=UPI000DCE5038|nr:hypothetical protein [Campylobacter hyointestinalis]RAZ55302.1 hypothetical protein CHL10074_05155 [Campylobacter hyointestinalis subsp. lawsonii]
MNYYESDFTEQNYRNILKKILSDTIFYDEICDRDKFVLWRHDVDFSIHRAYALAVLEKWGGVRSTYFIQLGSMFYNIFEQNIKELIFKILSLGHRLGLHFDPNAYKISNKDDMEKYLLFEKNILENLFQTDIKVFSYHNPTDDILKYDNFEIGGMINTYAKYFKDNVKYCSDSNGYWRFKRLENFLDEKNDKIQVLTHPGWWQKEVLSPRDRIKRIINGRAEFVLKVYDETLEKFGRVNVR